MLELPCPHCGETLLLSSKTAEGERARCGYCFAPTELRGGTLVPLRTAEPEPEKPRE